VTVRLDPAIGLAQDVVNATGGLETELGLVIGHLPARQQQLMASALRKSARRLVLLAARLDKAAAGA
jgi:hypothetical protein